MTKYSINIIAQKIIHTSNDAIFTSIPLFNPLPSVVLNDMNNDPPKNKANKNTPKYLIENHLYNIFSNLCKIIDYKVIILAFIKVHII